MIKLFGTTIPEESPKHLLKAKKPLFIVTLNPEILLHARKDFSYRAIINSADIKTIDGIGIVLMARLLYGKTLSRLTGVELAQYLLSEAQQRKQTVLLVGGTATANKKASAALGIQGLGGDFTWPEAFAIITRMRPHLLLVALGAPKQEQFIHTLFTTYPHALPDIAMGVGGAVDFWAYPGLRAPKIVQQIGLEWLWRGVRQPWRIMRIAKATIVFPFACLNDKLLVK